MASRSRIELAAFALVVLVAVAGGCGGSTSSTEISTSSTEMTTPTVVENVPSPGLPYLLYTSDRDGDEEIYGVRADGKRTVQVTRDDVDPYGVSIAPNWRWLFLQLGEGKTRLVSTDGRRAYELEVPWDWDLELAFTRDGGLLAYGEFGVSSRVRIVRTTNGRPRAVGRGQNWAFSPDDELLVLFDGAIDMPAQAFARLKFIDPSSGRVVRALDLEWPDDAPMYPIGWSPSGKRFAFVNGDALSVVDVADGFQGPREILTDARLLDEGDYDVLVAWIDDETFSMFLPSEDDDVSELSLVALDGEKTVLSARAYRYIDPVWFSGGSRVAFGEVRGAQLRTEVITTSKTGADRRIVLKTSSGVDLQPSPDRGVLVSYQDQAKSVITAVNQRGASTALLRTDCCILLGGTSPDGDFLSLGVDAESGTGSNSSRDRLRILSLADGSVVSIPVTGNVEVIGWVDSSVAEFGAPARVPDVEIAAVNRLQSSGEIAEISASGTRVAAIVASSKLDCQHVVAWKAGSSRVVRFAEPRPCGGDEEDLVGIALEGIRLTWTGEYWGNYAYLTDNSADMRHPEAGVHSSGGDEGYESGVERPKPERATRAGVSASVEDGAVVLARASDGRALRLLAPGPVVDAELENEGLFYAYNTSGAMKGHIVFIPFAKLFD